MTLIRLPFMIALMTFDMTSVYATVVSSEKGAPVTDHSQKHTQNIDHFQHTSILEESLPAFGDPDDRPQIDAPLEQDTSVPNINHNETETDSLASREREVPREHKLYQQAMHFISQQRPDLAQDYLKEIITSFPDRPESILAHYWTGEVFLEQELPGEASVAYSKAYQGFKSLKKSGSFSIETFHNEEERLPEILYKLALSLQKIGKQKEACLTLSQIPKEFTHLPPTLSVLIQKLKTSLKCR